MTIDIEKLKALHDRSTAAPWMAYSEPEVGLETSLFAGSPMVSGFGPVEPLSSCEIELIATLRNAVPDIITMHHTLERYKAALEAIKEDAQLQYSTWTDEGVCPGEPTRMAWDIYLKARETLAPSHD